MQLDFTSPPSPALVLQVTALREHLINLKVRRLVQGSLEVYIKVP